MDFKASRWEQLEETSPSGKTLFKCSVCGRISPTPDKTCKTFGDPKESKQCARHDQVKYHRYYLPSEKGEGWAIILIGSDGEFMALSDYGNYGFWWTAHGCKDAREFFLRCGRDTDYFATKLADGERVYDGDATEKGIKEYIIHCRRHAGWSKEQARKEWDLLKEHSVYDHQECFNNWLDDTNIEEAYEYRIDSLPRQVTAFVKRVLAGERFQKMLRQDLGLEPKEGEQNAERERSLGSS